MSFFHSDFYYLSISFQFHFFQTEVSELVDHSDQGERREVSLYFVSPPRALLRVFLLSAAAKLQYLPKVPGTLSKIMKKLYPSQHFNPYAFYVPPFPLKQCWSVPETFGVIVHEKIFRYRIYFSQKPTLFRWRRGTNVPSRLKICKVSQDFWRVL